MWYVWKTEEIHTEFWWGNLKKKTLGRPRSRWENIEMDLK
jgi:hypothetical protein